MVWGRTATPEASIGLEPTRLPFTRKSTLPVAVCPARGVGLTVAVRITGPWYWPEAAFTTVVVGALTVTLKLQLDCAPPESVALAVTFVVPTRKAEPEGGVATMAAGGRGQLSVAVTVKFAIADVCPG